MSNSQQQGASAIDFLMLAFLDETAADQALDAMKEAKPFPGRDASTARPRMTVFTGRWRRSQAVSCGQRINDWSP